MRSAEAFLGRQVAVYTIEELLGEGGFAFVYRAHDRNLDIDVALKVLKPAFAHDETFERNFRREAHRAAKFRHPNVVAIHYAGKEDDIVFFSMDLLSNGLGDRMWGAPVSQDMIVRVADDVASALQFAHTFEGGIIHRDLKPDNILFDLHGNAVVTDFGIAEAATSYTAATGTTVFVGTPRYMSPEQARGQRLDQRSDIYSLGVTLYEMAVGEPPFAGRDWFELGRKHIEQLPALPRERNPVLRPQLERIILKCLQKNPDDRYQTAQEIRDDLAACNGSAGPGRPAVEGTAKGDARAGVRAGPGGTTTDPEPSAPVSDSGAGPLAGARRKRRGVARTPAGSGVRERPEHGSLRAAARVLLALGLFGSGLIGAYHFDLGGFQLAADRRLPRIANLPVLGSGRIYAAAPTYRVVEGGADVAGTMIIPFTGPLDPATATSANVRLVGPDSTRLITQVALAPDGRSLVVEPIDSLRFATDYSLVVLGGIRSRRGVPVRSGPEADRTGLAFTITTRPPPPDATPPRLSSSVPPAGADDAATDATLRLTFTEPLDPESVDTLALSLRDDRGARVPTDLFWNSEFRVAELRPRAPLARRARYRVRIDSTLTDRSGNPMVPDSVPFRTAETRAAAAPSPARLDVRTVPAGVRHVVVVIDGDTLGAPPIRGYRVAGGTTHTVEVLGVPELSNHSIVLHRSRHAPGPGQTRSVAAEIEPFGSISVSSDPAGFVYVDGEPVGRVPLTGYPLLAGRRHALEIRPLGLDASRYEPYSVEVEVRPFEWKMLGRVKLRE